MSHCFGEEAWETPIGAVAESSLDVLDRIETVYGDIAECGGTGPDTSRINAEGSAYLRSNFPLLTFIRSAWPLDWQPPAQDVEVTQANQGQQSGRWPEDNRFTGQSIPPKSAAECSPQVQNSDTTDMLKKLEEQEKTHQAAMKEMERKILAVTQAAQRLQAAQSQSQVESSNTFSTPVVGSQARAAVSSPRTVLSPRNEVSSTPAEQLRDFPHGGRSVPVAIDAMHDHPALKANASPSKTGVGVPVETVSSLPSARGPPVFDVPVRVTPTSRKSLRGSREVQVEVSSPRGRVGASLSPRGRPPSNEVSFSECHSVSMESSIRFAPRYQDHLTLSSSHFDTNSRNMPQPNPQTLPYGGIAPQPSNAPHVTQPLMHMQPGHLDRNGIPKSQQMPAGGHATHPFTQAQHVGQLTGPMLAGYPELGGPYNQQHIPVGPPVQQPAHPHGPQPPAGQLHDHLHFAQQPPAQVHQVGPPKPFPWQNGPPPHIPQHQLGGAQSPRMPLPGLPGLGITDVAAAGAAALAPGNIRMQSRPPNFASALPFQPALGAMGPSPFGPR